MKRPNDEFKECALKLKRTTRDAPCDFEELTTNIDIMLHIYRLLQLKDQLQLCLCSDKLKWIFETFVWKRSYTTLTIIGFAHNYVVGNGTNSHQVCLPYEEYQLFLQVFAEGVRVLVSTYDAVPDLRLFENLTTLEYKFTRSFTKDNLRLIAENCRQLEELHLMYCGTRYLNFIDLEDVLDVNLLQNIPNLKTILVVDPYPDKIKYRHFLDIISRTQVKTAYLSACIVPDETTARSVEVLSLKTLKIEMPLEPSRWPTNYSSLLDNLKNLTRLILRVNDVVTDSTLQVIAASCKELEIFSFASTVFKEIKDFKIPPRVTSLSINACEGLTHDNLKQMLTQYRIKKFISEQTNYHSGVFTDFQISPTIETLNVSSITSRLFPSACRDNANLRDLTWYDHKIRPATIEPLLRVHVGTCLNLESLTIKSGFMPLTPLMNLKRLRKFSMPHSMPFLNWLYILILLKHPNLEEIYIGDSSPPTWVTKTIRIPSEGFVTNVTDLTISLRVFLSALRFWLELFNCNADMKLTCKRFDMNEKIIRHIVMHEKFPRDLRTINLTGFNISVQDLKRDFDRTMGKFMYDSNYKKIVPDKYHRITLCRKSQLVEPVFFAC